jgi:AcrR family transcriptional regulator
MSRVLTPKGQATRQRIIEGAAAALRNFGPDTTLDDIRAATATSKSQLFHYFPEGRTELLLAVARHEADQVLADQEPQLYALTSWPAWQQWRDLVVERYRSQGPSCPLGALTAQLRPGSPQTQAVIARLLDQWQSAIADGIRAMQAQGEIRPGVDPDQAAAALLAGIQGGVQIMLATNRIGHLEAALDTGIAALRAP